MYRIVLYQILKRHAN